METTITIPLDVLPEAKSWQIGEAYKVKMVLEQIALSENNATFEIVDATSLEPVDQRDSGFMSTEGMYLGKT